MPNELHSGEQFSGLGPESQSWVDASTARKPFFNWREAVIRGLYYTGGLRLARRIARSFELQPGSSLFFPRFRRIRSTKFVILCYHGIGESGNPLVAAPSVETFEAQMRFLRENYRIVSLDQVCEELNNSGSAEPGVAITFDDGYQSTYTLAFPILQKYKLPATIYLTLDAVESGQVAWYDRVFLAMAVAPSGELQLDLEGPWRFQLNSPEDRLRAAFEVVAHLRTLPNCRRRECCTLLERRVGLPQNALSSRILTWEQVLTMQRAGISFGSHTLSHPVVSQLAPPELESELAGSKRLLEERLGTSVKDFAFPFGKASDCSPAALEMLSRCGYRSAVTTVSGENTPESNRYELRRLQVGCDGFMARFAFDLNLAILRTEIPRALNVPQAAVPVAEREAVSASGAATFGDPDA